jgi:hypothetical protein
MDPAGQASLGKPGKIAPDRSLGGAGKLAHVGDTNDSALVQHGFDDLTAFMLVHGCLPDRSQMVIFRSCRQWKLPYDLHDCITSSQQRVQRCSIMIDHDRLLL